jgi:hypothetical protein
MVHRIDFRLSVVIGGSRGPDNRKTRLMQIIFNLNYHHLCKQNMNLYIFVHRNISIHIAKHVKKY